MLTVDNGTSSVDGVARANEIGVDVVITDHHLLAQANQTLHWLTVIETSKFQSKSMAGVGVAYYDGSNQATTKSEIGLMPIGQSRILLIISIWWP